MYTWWNAPKQSDKYWYQSPICQSRRRRVGKYTVKHFTKPQ